MAGRRPPAERDAAIIAARDAAIAILQADLARMTRARDEAMAELAALRDRRCAPPPATVTGDHLTRDERRAALARLVRDRDTPPTAAARLIELDAELAGEIAPALGAADLMGTGAAETLTDAELLAFVEGGGGGG